MYRRNLECLDCTLKMVNLTFVTIVILYFPLCKYGTNNFTHLLNEQMGRRAETIILPLELLRHLKPSEFNDPHEYHFWQKRQLKILEAGLLLHPSIPLDKSNTFAMRLRDIIRSVDTKAIDTGKNSDTMRTLATLLSPYHGAAPTELQQMFVIGLMATLSTSTSIFLFSIQSSISETRH